MKRLARSYITLIVILIILLLSSCNPLSTTTNDNIDDISKDLDQKEHIVESSTSILNMTDLEIIKKTGDYLKSRGETLIFEETEITYFNNETENLVCKDDKGQDVFYQGDYLQIKYYPHPNAEDNKCIIVFLGEEGKVLGYCKEEISQ